jgi:membrane-bound ClpP family serine protease
MEPLLVWGVSLLLAAIFLTIVEIFVPSAGVIAVTSVVTGLAGITCLFIHDTLTGVIGLLVAAVLWPAAFYWGLKIWPHTPLGRAMIGAPTEEEVEEARRGELEARKQRMSIVGAEGIVLTDLRPVGIVEIDGQRHDALSETTLVRAGERVRVTAIDSQQLRVRPLARDPGVPPDSPPEGDPPAGGATLPA